MKIWKKSWYRSPFLFKSRTQALSPVIGTLLVLLVTIILVSIVANAIFIGSDSHINSRPLMAKISIESCEGGLYNNTTNDEKAKLKSNNIVLLHKGGDALPFELVAVKISGDGNSYQGIVGDGKGRPINGNTEVTYQNLSPIGKYSGYKVRNKEMLKDNFWTVGEKLILNGKDSPVRRLDSSVRVTVNGIRNTSDNYGFKAGTEITLKVVDIDCMSIIAEQRAVVKHAEK